MAASLSPVAAAAKEKPKTVIPKRVLGRTGHMVTPLALGGQASLQWTPDNVWTVTANLGLANRFPTSAAGVQVDERRLDGRHREVAPGAEGGTRVSLTAPLGKETSEGG